MTHSDSGSDTEQYRRITDPGNGVWDCRSRTMSGYGPRDGRRMSARKDSWRMRETRTMRLHTNLPIRQCIGTLERHTGSSRGVTLVPDKTYMMKLNNDRFCIWRVYGSEMPRNMDICSPAFYGRLIQSNDGQGTVIAGRFGFRLLGLALALVLALLVVILVSFMVLSPPSAPFWTERDSSGATGTGIAIALGILLIWFVFAWIRDRASMIDFLVRILDAKRV